jgi:hypothetical protein
LNFPCFSRFFFSLSASLVSYSLTLVSASLLLSASSLSLRDGTTSEGLPHLSSPFLSGSVHAGGVSLAGAGFQVVSAPVPLGLFLSSGIKLNKKRIK